MMTAMIAGAGFVAPGHGAIAELRRALAPVGIIIWSTLRAVSPVFEGNKDWQIWRKP